MNTDSEEFFTATFDTVVLDGIGAIEKGDVVTFGDRLMTIRGREDNWSLESGMFTILTFSPYVPFDYADCGTETHRFNSDTQE